MNRRDFVRSLAAALVLPFSIPESKVPELEKTVSARRRLFFDPEDIGRIRANSQTRLLQENFLSWLNTDIGDDFKFLKKIDQTRDLIGDLYRLQGILKRESIVYLVTPARERRELLTRTLEAVVELPLWDYFLNKADETIGLQRAPETVIAILFAREALGEQITPELDKRILRDVAEKGCLPCYRTLTGIASGERGWHFDPAYASNYALDMSRWPVLLRRTNLKAVPVAGLGLGALAVEEDDARAEVWLDRAVTSAKEFLNTLQPDGSHEENIGYTGYSLRNLFTFFAAHERLHNDIDWFGMANFYGFAEFVTCAQLGQRPDGQPDIVNFGDINQSVMPASLLWIANRGGDTLAQYAAHHFTGLHGFFDYLWYDPRRKMGPPPDRLLDRQLNLGWIVCRTGWEPEDTVLAFRSGGPANHEHSDRNSFILKAFGERLLTDHFKAAYDWRDEGWLLRLTEAHNAVLMDGKGHVYHDGKEGTNASQASAEIVRYVQRGELVWWCSDGTEAYRPIDPDIAWIARTILFLKPDIFIIFDHLQKRKTPSTLTARFHPDNRDGLAKVIVDGNMTQFTIQRPNATLFAKTAARIPTQIRQGRLQLPEERGVFPYVEVSTNPDTEVQLVTAMTARRGNPPFPSIKIDYLESQWRLFIDDRTFFLRVSHRIPEVIFGETKDGG